MTNDWTERKGLISVLLLVAVGLWGYNAYQVVRGVRPAAPPPVETATAPPAPRRLHAPPAPYLGDFRDPFARPGSRPPEPPRRGDTSPPQPQLAEGGEADAPRPLPVRLAGTVGGTALLTDEAGRVHLARAGEDVGEVHVRRVDRDRVTVEFDKRRHTLSFHDDSDGL